MEKVLSGNPYFRLQIICFLGIPPNGKGMLMKPPKGISLTQAKSIGA
jgi:hypothetical protein